MRGFIGERDEEIVGVHQLTDDPVHGRVELLHILDGAGGGGDPVERRLHLPGPSALGLQGLQLGDPLVERVDLGHELGIECDLIIHTITYAGVFPLIQRGNAADAQAVGF